MSSKPNSRVATSRRVLSPSVKAPIPAKKSLHSQKSSIDISNLTKLIQRQKFEVINKQKSVSTQMLTILQKAKDIKNNHFFSGAVSRKDSMASMASLASPSRAQQRSQHLQPVSFVSLTSLGELISPKKFSNHNNQSQTQNKGKGMFNFKYVIGIGGFGKVWRVEHRQSRQQYAMKEMSKALVITKKSVNSVMNERTLLSSLKHPFLVNMYYAFQDRENLYLVMDYMQGGDLRYHIGKTRRFTEEQAKFFIACIFLGLEYLHNNNIIHRDIKPENLVLDERGYLCLSDLGIARVQRPDNANDTSGTPGYMAPEVMFRQQHTFAVDFYAMGVIAFELMLGRRPYMGRSRQEIRDQIFAKQVQIKRNEIPDGWSLEAADCINKLIQRKDKNRLGYSGPHEIKLHPWFKHFPWSKLQGGELKSPFIPNINEDNFDQRQLLLEDEENAELIAENIMILRDPTVQELFAGYEYQQQSLISTTTESNSRMHTRAISTQGRVDRFC